MSFTLEERRRLMRAYAPVLFLHRRESFVPVSPTAYMERAALWDDHSPGLHLRDNWGHPVEDAVFPRAPLLWPGQLTVNPAAAGGDVHFLGEQANGDSPFTQSDAERALFLDFRGWWEEGALPEFPGDPGRVQETTQNRWAFVGTAGVAPAGSPPKPCSPSRSRRSMRVESLGKTGFSLRPIRFDRAAAKGPPETWTAGLTAGGSGEFQPRSR